MRKKLTFLISLIFCLTLGLGFFVFASNVSANNELDIGISEVDSAINLATGDPRTVAVRIIQIVLGFLGLIAVVLILYAGFLWMTANGKDEKVTKAKGVLKNAVIGLIIILSSWGITVFILNQIMQATNNNGGVNFSGDGGSGSGNLGTGVLGACCVESFYPELGQKDVPRNTSILIQFKEPVNLETVSNDTDGDEEYCDGDDYINSDNIKIYVSDDKENFLTNVKVSHIDKMNFIFTPENLLGSFAEKTWYTVEINNNLEKENGENIFNDCSSDLLSWDFQIGTFLDLLPPKVKEAGVFPCPDNDKDSQITQSSATQATGNIIIEDYNELRAYQPASINRVTGQGTTPSASAEIDENYHQQLTNFSVSVIDNGNQAQLFQGTGSNAQLIMTKEFNNNKVFFENYFSLTSSDNPSVGNQWLVTIVPEVFADTLTVADVVYTFADNNNGNNIEISRSSNNNQAINIDNKISNNPSVTTTVGGSTVVLLAKVAGKTGNGINLSTTNASALDITPMSGGSDENIVYNVNDKKDKPRNSTIQVNFSEPINPLNVSGFSNKVKDTVRVINNSSSALSEGNLCSVDSDCLSYNCSEEGSCINNELSGKFILSNAFKTLEFISDNICGMNGCGETIYCLPENANLKVILETSALNPCESASNCAGLDPFTDCNENASLSYNVCQDQAGSNYPKAEIPVVSGIVDVANNSFDGNRDEKSDGPINYYSDNDINSTGKDGFEWSFWISDFLAIEPPKIEQVSPSVSGANSVSLIDPVEITFNTLMMKSSLKTGSTVIESGDKEFVHNLINLWGLSSYPLGYWINSDNIDTNDDGIVDRTIIRINHSLFSDSMTHYAEVGSGVKDIYQNCYKPSSGLDCESTDYNPSCCSGIPSESCSN